jgi:hypothetical protein
VAFGTDSGTPGQSGGEACNLSLHGFLGLRRQPVFGIIALVDNYAGGPSKRLTEMSEKVLKLLVQELKRIRIVCVKCSTAIEISIDQLKDGGRISCPICASTGPRGEYWLRSRLHHDDGYYYLAKGLEELSRDSHVRIEFVLPEAESGDTQP